MACQAKAVQGGGCKVSQLMDEVNDHDGEIVISKYGKSLARLTAFRRRPKTLFGIDKGRLEIKGDIVSPIDVEMDEVNDHDGEIVISKYGKSLARLTAFWRRPKTLFGIDKGRLEIKGDIVSPIDVEWEAEVDPDRVLGP